MLRAFIAVAVTTVSAKQRNSCFRVCPEIAAALSNMEKRSHNPRFRPFGHLLKEQYGKLN